VREHSEYYSARCNRAATEVQQSCNREHSENYSALELAHHSIKVTTTFYYWLYY
jgi:hypothetical protein